MKERVSECRIQIEKEEIKQIGTLRHGWHEEYKNGRMKGWRDVECLFNSFSRRCEIDQQYSLTFPYTRTLTHTRTCIHTYIHTHTRTHTHTHTYTHTHTHSYIHTHTHKQHIHTHTHQTVPTISRLSTLLLPITSVVTFLSDRVLLIAGMRSKEDKNVRTHATLFMLTDNTVIGPYYHVSFERCITSFN